MKMHKAYTDIELKNWEQQTRLFALYFLSHVRLPQGHFSLADVGCGNGEALRIFRAQRSDTVLVGIDLDPEHINICLKKNLERVEFICKNIKEIKGHYDLVFISNVLEHIPNWGEVVMDVMHKCDIMYMLVPYNEKIHEVSESTGISDHVNSFTFTSFNNLHGMFKIRKRVIRTPFAWGHPFRRELALRFKALIRKETFPIQRQLLVAISKDLPPPFRNRFSSWALSLRIKY